jgi:polysaccharide pyruvyl transferase WcaK-like protein
MTSADERLRTWLARVKAAPARIDRLTGVHESVADELTNLRATLAALDHRVDRIDRSIAGKTQLDDILADLDELRRSIDDRSEVVDRTLARYIGVLGRVATDPARRQALARLIDELGPSPQLRPGLSAFTVTWHHAGFLEEAVRSALAALDRLPTELQGEALVLDDGSLDETVDVTAQLTTLDRRVRVIRAAANIGVGHARNALLHAVTTTHAFQLDADNTAVADGVATLFQVATAYGAASVYGNILKVDLDGRPLGVISNEPITPAFFASNYIDTMAVVDVATLRSIGGWPTDPMIEHLDDWVATHALLRRGHLVGFVPVVAGRYRELEGAMHVAADHRLGADPIRRMWDNDGRLTADRVAAFAAHPDLGPLWATESARRLQPALVPPAEPEPPDLARILVVASGGVGNVGDDAITITVIDRLRRSVPDAVIEVVTDQDRPVGLRGVVWRCTLVEAIREQTVPTLDLGAYTAAVFAGGGSITSLWRSGLIEPRAELARRLTEVGVPYVMSGQGLGPFSDDDDRRLVARLLGGARRIAVRDPQSAELCRSLGVPPDLVAVTGDDALGLEPADRSTVEATLAGIGLGDRRFVAVTVREADYVGDHDLGAWADAVDRYAAERDLAVLGIALNDMPPSPEAATLARLAHGPVPRRVPWHLLPCERDPGLLAAVMAQADAAAVHSYHAALLALAGNRPAVLAAGTPYYRAKALGLAELAGLPDGLAAGVTAPLDLDRRLDLVAAAIDTGAGLTSATKAVDAWWTETCTLLAELVRATHHRSS